jgi:hypothetical protein
MAEKWPRSLERVNRLPRNVYFLRFRRSFLLLRLYKLSQEIYQGPKDKSSKNPRLAKLANAVTNIK